MEASWGCSSGRAGVLVGNLLGVRVTEMSASERESEMSESQREICLRERDVCVCVLCFRFVAEFPTWFSYGCLIVHDFGPK